MSSLEELGSFFFYSMIVYPITNSWILKPGRVSKAQAIMRAVLFLSAVAFLHIQLERYNAVNHYQRLGVGRNTSAAGIKRAYKSLSLYLHPDKNKSPTAHEEFQRVKHAYDVLTDSDSRKIYDTLGEEGIKLSTQVVVDTKQIIVRLLVSYSSHLIIAIIMTISEASGNALTTSLMGMLVMVFVEASICLHRFTIPGWFFPQVTPHEFVWFMHRSFPAFMNGCRCIYGFLYVDPVKKRGEALVGVYNSLKATVQSTMTLKALIEPQRHSANGSHVNESVVQNALRMMRQRRCAVGEAGGEDGTDMVEASIRQIQSYQLTNGTFTKESGWHFWRNLALYLIAHYALKKGRGRE